MNDSDEILVKSFRAGDLGSFEALVSRYQQKIFSFIYRMVMSEEDARDLAQEAFVQAFRSLNGFREEARFSTWLYRLAANKALDFLRRNKRCRLYYQEGKQDFSDLPAAASTENNPELIYLREEKIRRLRRMIAGLPDRYRVAIVLFHYEDMTYQQIAETLDIPVKTVATRLYRAKLILKENLGGETNGMP